MFSSQLDFGSDSFIDHFYYISCLVHACTLRLLNLFYWSLHPFENITSFVLLVLNMCYGLKYLLNVLLLANNLFFMTSKHRPHLLQHITFFLFQCVDLSCLVMLFRRGVRSNIWSPCLPKLISVFLLVKFFRYHLIRIKLALTILYY